MKNRLPFFGRFLFAILFAFVFSVSAEAATSPCPFTWTNNIRIGSEGEEVLKLQQFLNLYPDTVIAASGAGSIGNESISYGPRTAKAVVKFQEKYAVETLAPVGLTKGSGFVGTLTRAKLNSLCVSNTSTSSATKPDMVAPVASEILPVPAISAVAVSEDLLTVTVPEQPAHTLAPAGAGWVPFTSITLTAGTKDVTVNSMTVQRTGYGADGAFFSIQLADEEGNPIGDDRSLRSDHKVDLGDPFVISTGQSKTITVMANMASDLTDYDGQMPIFQINSIQTSARVSGAFPIRGTAQTVNTSLVIGIAYAALSQFDPSASVNRYINDKGVRFSGVRFSADSKEDLEFSSITWDQTGTAGNADITNVTTVVNGVSYPTTIDGRKFTSIFEPAIVIKKGNSLDLYIQGDLATGGSNRTVKFDIRESGDISISGQSYGYYVLVLPESATATSGNSVFITSDGTTDGDEGSPFFSGSTVTINAGAFTSVGK
ncbi:MAG: hypothetical protein Q7S86_02790 [bacterium]|nr:hypothetical protein [bacterium]